MQASFGPNLFIPFLRLSLSFMVFFCELEMLSINVNLAYRHGTRYIYTWVGIFICQITFGLSTAMEVASGIETGWNAQGLLTFFGGRFPISAIFGVNQAFLYSSYIFVQRLN